MEYPLQFPVSRAWGANADPRFDRPQIVGYYSINGDREISCDLSRLKYHQRPKSNNVELDLNHGYEVARHTPPDAEPEKLKHLFQWILMNSSKIQAPTDERRWLSPHFVCSRGLLRMLCCTPFFLRAEWIICACMWKGTIYLYHYDTEEKKLMKANRTERELRCLSWGYKFKQYMLSESPNKWPEIQQPVNEREQFSCIFRSTLGENKLLYAAEMDGVMSSKELKDPINWDKQKFVELKTTRIIESYGQKINFRKSKSLKWWCRSFLVGIDNVLCGMRDDNGVVRQLWTMRVANMPKFAQKHWTAAGCKDFGNEFLNYVKSVVRNDSKVYKFEYNRKCGLQVQQLDDNSEYSFIPQWFIDRSNWEDRK